MEIKLKTYFQPEFVKTGWCVYLIKDKENKLIFIGHCKITQVFSIPDLRAINDYKKYFDDDETYALEVLTYEENSAYAQKTLAATIKELGWTPLMKAALNKNRRSPIRCITTGEIFNTINEAAFAHGCAASALSNHLRNRPGFVSVKGKHYERIGFGEWVTAHNIMHPRPVQPATTFTTPEIEPHREATIQANTEYNERLAEAEATIPNWNKYPIKKREKCLKITTPPDPQPTTIKPPTPAPIHDFFDNSAFKLKIYKDMSEDEKIHTLKSYDSYNFKPEELKILLDISDGRLVKEKAKAEKNDETDALERLTKLLNTPAPTTTPPTPTILADTQDTDDDPWTKTRPSVYDGYDD